MSTPPARYHKYDDGRRDPMLVMQLAMLDATEEMARATAHYSEQMEQLVRANEEQADALLRIAQAMEKEAKR